MFILFGSPRSGTTLLKEMLCQHPQVIVPHETDCIIPIAFILNRIQDGTVGKRLIAELICSTSAFGASLGRYLDQRDVEEVVARSHYSLPSLLDAMYAAVAQKAGARIAGDKSPNDLAHVGILRQTGIFASDIRIIHIVRDVRDVILSLKKTEWAPVDVEQYFPRIWAESNLNLQWFASQGSAPYLQIHYENLIQDTVAVAARVCDFLDIGFDGLMCEYSRHGKELSHLAHHQNLGKEPQQSRRFAWKQHADRVMIEKCEVDTSVALREFGYECP